MSDRRDDARAHSDASPKKERKKTFRQTKTIDFFFSANKKTRARTTQNRGDVFARGEIARGDVRRRRPLDRRPRGCLRRNMLHEAATTHDTRTCTTRRNGRNESREGDREENNAGIDDEREEV